MYTGDNNVVLKIEGLRFISKQDFVHGSPNMKDVFRLKWNYKGADGYIDYESKIARDLIFDSIKVKLTGKDET